MHFSCNWLMFPCIFMSTCGWCFCMSNSGAAQRVFLSSNNLTPCYNDTVDLICHYPDVMERVNEQLRYSVTIPSWRMDGWVIFPDEDVFSQGPINQTASRLRVRTDPAIFTGDPVSFTCYLLLSSGGEDSASTVVKPQGVFLTSAWYIQYIQYIQYAQLFMYFICTCIPPHSASCYMRKWY